MQLFSVSARVAGLAILTIVAASTSALSQHSAPLPGSPSRGAEIYEAKCGACHSLDANRIGPKHRGVYGRKAGSVADFNYTPALKKSGIVWNDQTLDRWLQGPTKMVPGTAMSLSLSDAQDRADVIAYLKQQSAKH